MILASQHAVNGSRRLFSRLMFSIQGFFVPIIIVCLNTAQGVAYQTLDLRCTRAEILG